MKPDKMLEEALKHTAGDIATSRIERADHHREWTMGEETTMKEKRAWVASGYFPRLQEQLRNLDREMQEYIRAFQKS